MQSSEPLKAAKPVVWSHSSLKAFEQCPRKFHEEKVLKRFPFKDTEATIYGKELHSAAEFYIKDGTPLPAHFAFLKPTLDALAAKPGRKLTEYEMAVDARLRPCGFKDPQVWARGIADLLIVDDDNLTAWCADYKSGNDKYPDRDQLTLMSLFVFAHFPHVRVVRSALLFVVKDTMVKHRVELAQATNYWQDYRERVAALEGAFASGVWDPKQSGLCRRHCPIASCEFNGGH